MYTIIDVETTGKSGKITEISIFKYDGQNIIDEFTSLVNPQTYIPGYITQLTGIDNSMVAGSPTFSQIAQNILEITHGCIFVAHSVNFDYNVIRNEFKNIGVKFSRKKLCTVKLSRQLLPGHDSYSLGNICYDLNIDIVGRHRARGDAEATVILFHKLLNTKNSKMAFNASLNKTVIQSQLRLDI